MSEMIERVARAICANSRSGFCLDVGGHLGCKNGRGVTPHWTNCVANATQLGLCGHESTARAALKAMWEPTYDMRMAGPPRLTAILTYRDMGDIWKAKIAAALKTTP